MYRLLAVLGAGLFLTLLIGGRDAGQTRFGLQGAYEIAALREAAPTVRVAAERADPVTEAVVARADPAPKPDPAPASTPGLTQISFAPAAAATEGGDPLAPGLTLSLPLVPDAAAPDLAAPDLAATEPAAVVEPEPMRIGRVIGTQVNLREQPSAKAAVLDRLARGEAVTVISTDDSGWSLVRIEGDGVEGYIASRYLADDTAGSSLFPSE